MTYAWGTAKAEDLQRALDLTSPGKCVAVHIAELAEALRLGTVEMFNEADSDSALAQRLIDRGGRYFSGMNPDFTPSNLPLGFNATAT